METKIVKYSNQLNSIPITRLTKLEQNLFITICAEAVDKGTNEIKLSLSGLKKMAGIERLSYDKFSSFLVDTIDKISSLGITTYLENDGDFARFYLFRKFEVYKSTDEVIFSVNEEFVYLFNKLVEHFTYFELIEYLSMDSTYSQSCYRMFKQYTSGWWKISIDDFKDYLGLPESYKMSHINDKVLKKVEEENAPLFKEFSIEKVYEKSKKGRPRVSHLIFRYKEKDKMIQTMTNFNDPEIVNKHPYLQAIKNSTMFPPVFFVTNKFTTEVAPKLFPIYEMIDLHFGRDELTRHINYMSKNVKKKRPDNMIAYLTTSAKNHYKKLAEKPKNIEKKETE